jgi:hypothetical protein
VQWESEEVPDTADEHGGEIEQQKQGKYKSRHGAQVEVSEGG